MTWTDLLLVVLWATIIYFHVLTTLYMRVTEASVDGLEAAREDRFDEAEAFGVEAIRRREIAHRWNIFHWGRP